MPDKKEWNILRMQFASSSRGGKRYQPFAFTDQGVAMLASILNSPKSIQINIQIVRTFILLRQYALGYAELNKKLEMFMLETNIRFTDIYQALTELASKKQLEENPRNKVGYERK